MKKFGGKKPMDVILKDAKKQGFNIDTKSYDDGRDYIWFSKKYESDLLRVGYNTFNGNFLGSYGEIEFSNMVDTFDDENRMMMLFDLFYLPPKESV